jgi:hypothetical protein
MHKPATLLPAIRTPKLGYASYSSSYQPPSATSSRSIASSSRKKGSFEDDDQQQTSHSYDPHTSYLLRKSDEQKEKKIAPSTPSQQRRETKPMLIYRITPHFTPNLTPSPHSTSYFFQDPNDLTNIPPNDLSPTTPYPSNMRDKEKEGEEERRKEQAETLTEGKDMRSGE